METKYIEIDYADQKVYVQQYLSESKSQFNKKLEFIKKMEGKNVDWREANKLSKLWYAIKYKQCRYQPEVYNRVMMFDKL
jgi:DNA-dependent RNA polymerase auxiliary subunit epsilon